MVANSPRNRKSRRADSPCGADSSPIACLVSSRCPSRGKNVGTPTLRLIAAYVTSGLHGMVASIQSLAGSIVALVTTDQTVQVSAVDYWEMVFNDPHSAALSTVFQLFDSRGSSTTEEIPCNRARRVPMNDERSRHCGTKTDLLIASSLPLLPQQCSWRLALGSVDSQLHAPSG